MTRKTKLTPEVQTTIVEALRKGNWFKTACDLAGVDFVTAYGWIARGEGRDPKRHMMPIYVDFAKAIRDVQATAEAEAVDQWVNKFKHDWRAVAEFLARRYPERWSPTMRTEVTHAGNIEVTRKPDLETMESGALLERADRLEQMARRLLGEEETPEDTEQDG